MIKTALKKALLTPLICAVALFATEIPQKVIQTGDKLSKELLKKLSTKLQYEMKTNGLIAAAGFCSSNALILTQEVNLHQVKGLSVKRISLKERNPANIPSQEEAKVLESLQKLLEKKELPSYMVEEGTKSYKYYKPLSIKKEACLQCHGDTSKKPELDSFLKDNYPNDKATGYKMGDLRGAIVVEIQK